MRYTKYQYKKEKKGIKFLGSLAITIIAAGIIGLIIARGVLKFMPNFIEGNNIKIPDNISEGVVEDKKESFTFVQCGYFSKEDNAKQVLSSLGSAYNSFILKDESGKFRVSAGIFTKEEAEKVITSLNDKGIINAKIDFVFNINKEEEAQLSAIIDGYIKIVNTLADKDVKGVNTAEFKKWTSELKEVSEGENQTILKELKTHISQLADEIKKEDIVNEAQYICNILLKLKV